MITERDLEEAIKECEGVRNPTSSTCVKLASYYTILDRMRGETHKVHTEESSAPIIRGGYSMSSSESEFMMIIEDKGIMNAIPIIEELMETLSIINPKLYDSVIRKLKEL